VARDPSRTFTLREPATLSAHVKRRGSDLRVESLAIRTLFLDAKGGGDLDTGVTLNAKLDLAGLQGGLRDLIDFGALELAGKGQIAAKYRRAGAVYSGLFAAEFQGLRIAGLASQPIERDSLRLEAAMAGPVTASGLPQEWNAAQVRAEVGEIVAALSATSKDQVISAKVDASGRIPWPGSDALADARMVIRWHDASWRSTSRSSGSSPPTPR
jgi:translocation and assembly module TamB